MSTSQPRTSTAPGWFRYSSLTPMIGAGRTVLALAQFSVLLFTTPRALFVQVGDDTLASKCDAYPGFISAYCFGLPLPWATALVGLGLLIVATGIAPRYTTVLHAWLSLSFTSVATLPDGGDVIAQVFTLLLIPVLLADRRTWHWQKPNMSSKLAGVAWGGLWALRLQMAFIYFDSAVSKFSVDAWHQGTAIYYVTRMEYFGSAGPFSGLFHTLTAVPALALTLSWGTMAAELTIAACLVIPRPRVALVAWSLSLALHLGIVVMIGLVSFGFIMIGAVTCATSPLLWQLLRVHPRITNRQGRRQTTRVSPSSTTSDLLLASEPVSAPDLPPASTPAPRKV